MCGGVRGVGAGGIVSTAFCILYKLYTLKLTRKQVQGLINHSDSPYIRGLGFMYIRFTQPPADLWEWFESYLEDEEEIDVRAGGGQTCTIGQMVRHMLTKLEWHSTLFPRIPVPIQKDIEKKLADKGSAKVTQTTERYASGRDFVEESRRRDETNGEFRRNRDYQERDDRDRREREEKYRERDYRDKEKEKYRDRPRERSPDRGRERDYDKDRRSTVIQHHEAIIETVEREVILMKLKERKKELNEKEEKASGTIHMPSTSLFTEIFVFKQKGGDNRQISNPIVNMYRSSIEVKLRGRFFGFILDVRLVFFINQLKTRPRFRPPPPPFLQIGGRSKTSLLIIALIRTKFD
ncbi:Pre-mRNA-splicing factor 38B [Armadillidium nasatum]|uniref:Pre-mRNA-splicing factor 38 n=1 Tax=Armadillidium nasatum TaxID=96803 RepID=A0A5N5TNL9_9CRUS|nr:Pre-mRNA-splicing factor 38B [Armadillidium nasatum]